MAILSGMVAITVGLFGILKMRKKKNKLKEYMQKIEEISKSDKDPRDKELELKELKGHIREEFSNELIVENHYIILEREVDNAIGDIRTGIIEQRVEMPEDLKGEVQEILEDGVVTKEEYRIIMDKIRLNRELSAIEKNKLNSMMTRWMLEGKSEDAIKRNERLEQKKPEFKQRRPEVKVNTPETKSKSRSQNPDTDDDFEFDDLD
jgi:hypothetical protein